MANNPTPPATPDEMAQTIATALQHDLTLVTRNTADFDGMGVRLVNPWQG